MRALVVGASGGIGQALARELGAQGAEVVGLSRIADGLDVTDEGSLRDAFARLQGPFDMVLVATGALSVTGAGPEKTLRAVHPAEMAAQFALNAVGPLLVLKHALALMPRDRRAVFAALSARVGSIGDNGLGGWYSYRAAKAALNQLVHTAAIEVARSHPQAICMVIHPGTVATPFTEGFPGRDKATPDEAARRILSTLDSLTPAESGGFRDSLGRVVPW